MRWFCAARAKIAATIVADATSRKTLDDLLAEARTGLDRLEPHAAFEAQSEGALLVDTRSHDERRRTGVIPGSLHIPRSVLEWRLDPDANPAFHNPHVVGLDQHLILVCAHGESTSLAAATLQELGFARATDVVGGFTAWQEARLPVDAAPEVDPDAVPGMGDPAPG
jgi:rhodanese-related sulfurtransferase